MSEKNPKMRPGIMPATTSDGTRLVKFWKIIPSRLAGRHALLILISCIFLVIASVWFFSGRHGGHPAAKQNSNSAIAEQPLLPEQQVQVLRDKGDYAAAEKVWQQQLEQTKDTTTKLSIYFQMSQISLRFKRYNDATNYAEAAMKLQPASYIPYAIYAKIAEAKGDKVAAKKYLEQTIAHIDINQDAANLTIRDYQAELDGLK